MMYAYRKLADRESYFENFSYDNNNTLRGEIYFLRNVLLSTRPKLNFATCPAYQSMTFPTHIWQRIGQNFMQANEMYRKSCPI